MILRAVTSVILAYLIGSISFALLVGRILFNKDIRNHGSGNLGATNTIRVLGWAPGIIVFVLDVLKGLSAVLIAGWLLKGQSQQILDIVKVSAGLAAILGHDWSIYIKFTGGRGVLTAAGVILALFWQVTLIELVIFLIVVALFRYVSLGSLVIAICLPLLVIYFYPGNYSYIVFALIAASLVIYKHRPNIRRLLNNEESKVGRKTVSEGIKNVR